MSDVKIVWDNPAIARVTGQAGTTGVRKAARITVQRAQANIVASGRVKTGRMLDQTKALAPVTGPDLITTAVVISDVHYSGFQEAGTRRIKPAWFLRNALASLTVRDFTP